MAFYYIKSGGTATDSSAGREATARTGAFEANANNYPSIAGALATTGTAPAAGDVFIVSDVHNHDNVSTAITNTFPATGIPIAVISVSDSAMETYAAGGKEQTNQNIGHNNKSAHYGMTYDTSTLIGATAANSSPIYYECTFELTTSSDFVGSTLDGCYIELNNCTVNAQTTSNGLRVEGGSQLTMNGGAYTATTTSAGFILGPSVNGGGKIVVNGVDLSELTGSVVTGHGAGQTTDDNLEIILNGCKIPAGVTFFDESLTNHGVILKAFNCSDTSAGAEYQFYIQDYFGTAEDDTVIYRNETTAFASGQKVSIKATTTANVSNYAPFAFDLPARYCALSSASTDTIRVYFASPTATVLTDATCWAEVYYPDGTNKHVYNRATNRATNLIATGTTHTDDSGASTWKQTSGAADLTGHNEYRMDIATSGDVGADCFPLIRIFVGVPSVTMYFDTVVDVVA